VEAETAVEVPVVEEAPAAEPAVEAEPAAPRAEEVEAETAVGAPVVEEAPAAEPAVEAEPAALRAEEAEVKARPKVIIVDPDQEGRTEIQKMLALSSFAVLGQTGYGREAIVLAKQSKPDVLMVAIEEPIVRATKMVEALADLLPQSPIVVYSSRKDTDSIRRAMLAGAKDYLITPVKEEELVRSVHTVLAQEERCRQRLRGEVEGPATVGKVITVFGAKGGIGKTTIATNLAAAIAQETRESVVLVDLDPRFGDVGILLDIPAERSIADLALPAEEITKELIQDSLYTHNTGVTILAAPVRPTEWRNVHVGHIERVVTLLAQTYDYVFLDTPGTFNDVVTRALELATTVLLVTTPHVASLKDTLLAINMLRSWNLDQDKIKLVVNATNEAANALPKDMERMLGQEVFWSIPYDPNIPVAAQLGTPAVIAQTKAADSLTEMAMALSGTRAYRKRAG
jgi:pilus assembly protein CpaE